MRIRRVRSGGVAALALVAAVATAVGCGSGGSSNTSASAGGAASTSAGSSGGKQIKVGAALIGPKNDKSFNQSAYEGMLKAAKEHPNLKLTSVLENRDNPSNETDAVQTLAPIDQVMVGVSASFGPVFDATVDKFPNTTFVTLFGAPKKFHKNVFSFVPDRGFPAYEAGVIAAHLTKSKVVGFIGGADIPPTEQSLAGFLAGVSSVDPSIKVLKNIIGDFNDVAKAKAATSAMLSDKADVLMPYLDAGIAGAFAAGKESGKNPPMFKLDLPDCSQYANTIGTDVGDNTVATDKMLSAIAGGTLNPPGEAVFAGLENPSLQRLQLCPKYQKLIGGIAKKTVDDLNSGKIKLPASALNPRPNYPWRQGFDGQVHNAGSTG
ncbi:MAG TPA: BMP family ABC transporter substrate-binding protein [Thermoleophilaceae bacterium]|nr:BMP family ABC transporter substrate-binding protein [Thermoleophilaceae bacterium]